MEGCLKSYNFVCSSSYVVCNVEVEVEQLPMLGVRKNASKGRGCPELKKASRLFEGLEAFPRIVGWGLKLGVEPQLITSVRKVMSH